MPKIELSRGICFLCRQVAGRVGIPRWIRLGNLCRYPHLEKAARLNENLSAPPS